MEGGEVKSGFWPPSPTTSCPAAHSPPHSVEQGQVPGNLPHVTSTPFPQNHTCS